MYPDVVTDRKNSDASVPLTAAQAEVLNKLLNPAGTLFAVGERLAALEAKVAELEADLAAHMAVSGGDVAHP
jgi:hypothetical protein